MARPSDRDSIGDSDSTALALALLVPLTDLVAAAAAAILAVNRKTMAIESKADGSPVTQADLAADAIIVDRLQTLAPDIPIVSEERIVGARPPYSGTFFLVDPLDGTKEFVAGRDEYTVNVALVVRGVPLLGIVGAPALGRIWRGIVGHGAERIAVTRDAATMSGEPVRTRAMPTRGNPWIAAVSRSHSDPRTEAYLAARAGGVQQPLGSAIKFCRVAEGGADVYPRLSPVCEWDIAAGHAVLVAAGGAISNLQGGPLHYGGTADGFLVPEFIACGDPQQMPLLIEKN